MLERELAQVQQDRDNGTIRLCFRSKKLFRSQFYPEQNGYASHEEWLSEWQAARNSQFFVLGSKDETAGCQECVATVADDGSITLPLRLPNAFPGECTVIPGLWFASRSRGHRPKGTARPAITPLVASEIPVCESSLIPFE